jgi:hypothetical protein
MIYSSFFMLASSSFFSKLWKTQNVNTLGIKLKGKFNLLKGSLKSFFNPICIFNYKMPSLMFSIVKQFRIGMTSLFFKWCHDLSYQGVTFITKQVRWSPFPQPLLTSNKPWCWTCLFNPNQHKSLQSLALFVKPTKTSINIFLQSITHWKIIEIHQFWNKINLLENM